jgi:hypothetical protein
MIAQSVYCLSCGLDGQDLIPSRDRDSFFSATVTRLALGLASLLSNGYQGLIPWVLNRPVVKLIIFTSFH